MAVWHGEIMANHDSYGTTVILVCVLMSGGTNGGEFDFRCCNNSYYSHPTMGGMVLLRVVVVLLQLSGGID